jgi:hypothetical protein
LCYAVDLFGSRLRVRWGSRRRGSEAAEAAAAAAAASWCTAALHYWCTVHGAPVGDPGGQEVAAACHVADSVVESRRHRAMLVAADDAGDTALMRLLRG